MATQTGGAEDVALLGICFWREGRGNPGLAEYMGEKGGWECQRWRRLGPSESRHLAIGF